MSEIFPQKIHLFRVSSEWYQVVADNYLVSGSQAINCFFTSKKDQLNNESLASDAEPGSLTLFSVDIDGCEYIVGGAFLLSHRNIMPERCWRNMGVRSGFKTFEDFINAVEKEGGNKDEALSCYILNSTFLFTHANMIKIPDEFSLHYESRTRLSFDINEPFARYIMKITLDRRSTQLKIGNAHQDWSGLYFLTSHSRSATYAATAFAQLLNLYNFRCAITGSEALPVLDVAHIRSLYDDSFNYPQNCIIMRNDMHRLFSAGYITANYKNDDKIVVEISRSKLSVLGDYAKYDGCLLSLPEDKSLWPSKENLEWHHEVRFENWLKQGEFSIADPKKHMHRLSKIC